MYSHHLSFRPRQRRLLQSTFVQLQRRWRLPFFGAQWPDALRVEQVGWSWAHRGSSPNLQWCLPQKKAEWSMADGHNRIDRIGWYDDILKYIVCYSNFVWISDKMIYHDLPHILWHQELCHVWVAVSAQWPRIRLGSIDLDSASPGLRRWCHHSARHLATSTCAKVGDVKFRTRRHFHGLGTLSHINDVDNDVNVYSSTSLCLYFLVFLLFLCVSFKSGEFWETALFLRDACDDCNYIVGQWYIIYK